MSHTQCTQPDGSASTQEEAVLLEWSVHLLRESPSRATAVYAAALLVFVLGLLLFHSVVFGLVGLAVILSSTAEFLLPIRYRLTDRRACCSYGLTRLEIPWERVARVLEVPGGLRLSPLAESSRLDAFRGVLLRFGADGGAGDRGHVEAVVASAASRAARVQREPVGA